VLADKIEIRDVEPGDIDMLVANMRDHDIQEVNAATRMGIENAVKTSVNLSTYSKTGLVNDELVCMWGVCPISLLSSSGSPWMLGTDLIKKKQRIFLRRSKPWLDDIRKDYRYLENFVDERNVMSIKWLKWLGFEMDEAEPYGIHGEPFHKFTMEI
jgi:hypothetical protein|tara:strand:+ start:791 stop:1258 length:468 start_codon:yes stop_codon:yes gene_type:complete